MNRNVIATLAKRHKLPTTVVKALLRLDASELRDGLRWGEPTATKSDCARELHKMGQPVAAIARLLQARYSHVYEAVQQ